MSLSGAGGFRGGSGTTLFIDHSQMHNAMAGSGTQPADQMANTFQILHERRRITVRAWCVFAMKLTPTNLMAWNAFVLAALPRHTESSTATL